jgi:hypothetical protein
MNYTFPPPTERASFPCVLLSGLVLTLAALAPAVHAGPPFRVGDSSVKQVLCEMNSISGKLDHAQSRYTGSGTCIELQSPQKSNDAQLNISEFPRVNESTQLFKAAWTSQGTYNPVTKETWEKVTMPAPATDEKSSVGRPYGNYETRMICATDPWLTGTGVNCTGKTVNATGNLGDAEAMLRMLNRPLTTPSKPDQLQALIAAHDRDARLQTPVAKVETNDSKTGAIVLAPKPSVVEPREGATYPPQTPLRVRIVPAKDAKDTAYRLEIQVQANFDWRDVTSVATSAAVAQSPDGYRGWGGRPGAPVTAMTATAGVYRIRARGTAPKMGQPGDWVEFRIDGQPGIQVDVMNRAMKAPPSAGEGTARSAASHASGGGSIPAALATAPAVSVKNPGTATSLNPQPLPPRTAPGSLTVTPAPGGLPQAPGSLR